MVVSGGLIDYARALERQRALVEDVIAGGPDTLFLCEHPAVITLGRRSHEAHLLRPRKDLAAQGVSVISVDRGGDVTLHAPGQMVIYPVVNLKRRGWGLGEYLRKLEQLGVDLLKGFGILATGDDGRRGVWVGKEKVASIGIGVRRWVTYHGMAVNVNNDLGLFRLIRPCGLDVQMTSLGRILGKPVDMAEVRRRIEQQFKDFMMGSSI
ncbi:MAG: lipoyl(octanoyl) transferase LipB [Elusimicrobia bacterium]|nr:lipoyl(octanoyl) transferase LipB [Elusimicrobiota bacterium]